MLPTWKRGLRCVGLLPLAMGACALGPLACRGDSAEATASDHELVGGRPAAEGEFPSTMMIAESCTAAKVGPRHILTAGHCVLSGETPGTPRPRFQNGATLHVTTREAANNLDPNDPAYVAVVVERTHIQPTWLREEYNGGALAVNPAADVAIVELTEESAASIASVPSARIDAEPVAVNDKLVVMGYGCERGLQTGFDYTTARLKVQSTVALAEGEAIQFRRSPVARPGARTADNYFFTPGAATAPDAAASLCPGDSGGPVYRDDGTGTVIVGVNAYYNFDYALDSAVSVSNWHTRLDRLAREGIHDWVRSIVPDPLTDGGVRPVASDGGVTDAGANDGGGSDDARASEHAR